MTDTHDGAVFQTRKVFNPKTLSYTTQLVETGRISVSKPSTKESPADDTVASDEPKKGIVAKAKAAKAKRKAKKTADS